MRLNANSVPVLAPIRDSRSDQIGAALHFLTSLYEMGYHDAIT